MADRNYTLSVDIAADAAKAAKDIESVALSAEKAQRNVEALSASAERLKSALSGMPSPTFQTNSAPTMPSPSASMQMPQFDTAALASAMGNTLANVLSGPLSATGPVTATGAVTLSGPVSLSVGGTLAVTAGTVTVTTSAAQPQAVPAPTPAPAQTQTPTPAPSRNETRWAALAGGIAAGFSKSAAVIRGAFSVSLGIARVAFRALGSAASSAFSAIGSAVRTAGRLLVNLATGPFRMISSALSMFKNLTITAAGGIAAAWGGIKAVTAAIAPAAEFEQYRNQLEVLLKSRSKAESRFGQLKTYAKDTNFNPDEVIGAGAAMQAFGLWNADGMKRLRLAGDLANSFGKSIQDVVQSINYLKSGRGGEAMESLSRMGVTREALAGYGVKFAKSGEMVTEPKKAVNALFRYIEANYRGMTARMGQTWKGAVAQMGGELKDALGEGLNGLLPMMTRTVRSMSVMFSDVGKFLKSVDWQKMMAGPLAVVSGAAGLVGQLANPETRSAGMAQLKELWSGLKATLSAAWDGLKGIGAAFLSGLGDIGKGIAADIGAFFKNMSESDSWGRLFTSLFDGLASTFRAGVELFKGMLSSVFPEQFSAFRRIIEMIPGVDKTETEKYNAAEQNVVNGIYRRIVRSGNAGSASREDWETRIRTSQRFRKEIRDSIRESMGWSSSDYSQPYFDAAKASARNAGSAFSGFLSIIGGNLSSSELMSGLSSAGGRLSAAASAAWNGTSSAANGPANILKRGALSGARADELAAWNARNAYWSENGGRYWELVNSGYYRSATGRIQGNVPGRASARRESAGILEEYQRLTEEAQGKTRYRRSLENSMMTPAAMDGGRTSSSSFGKDIQANRRNTDIMAATTQAIAKAMDRQSTLLKIIADRLDVDIA